MGENTQDPKVLTEMSPEDTDQFAMLLRMLPAAPPPPPHPKKRVNPSSALHSPLQTQDCNCTGKLLTSACRSGRAQLSSQSPDYLNVVFYTFLFC